MAKRFIIIIEGSKLRSFFRSLITLVACANSYRIREFLLFQSNKKKSANVNLTDDLTIEQRLTVLYWTIQQLLCVVAYLIYIKSIMYPNPFEYSFHYSIRLNFHTGLSFILSANNNKKLIQLNIVL